MSRGDILLMRDNTQLAIAENQVQLEASTYCIEMQVVHDSDTKPSPPPLLLQILTQKVSYNYRQLDLSDTIGNREETHQCPK